MTPGQLRIFAAVVEHRSFSRAAAATRQTQPSVSKTIKALEESFGAPLLVRAAGGVATTSLGENVLRHAHVVLRELDALDALSSENGGALRGSLRVAALPSLSGWPLPKILAALRRRHPEIVVRLFEGDGAEITSWLDSDVIDVALAMGPSPGWAWTELLEEPFVAVLRRRDAGTKTRISMGQLSRSPMIVWSCGTGIEHRLRDAFGDAHLGLNKVFEARSYNTLCAMVEDGIGVSVLPRSIALDVPSSLIAIPIIDAPQRKVGLIARPDASRMVRALVEEAVALAATMSSRTQNGTPPSA